MPRINTTKKHLLVKRAEIIYWLGVDGYNNDQIGDIFFGVHRSTIKRIIDAYDKVLKQVTDKRSSKK